MESDLIHPEQPAVDPDRDLLGHPPPPGRPDWSHRRGEPRLFAIAWMLFLLIAGMLMIGQIAGAQSYTGRGSRMAAEGMVLSAFVGVCLLWPMLRLTQRPPPDIRSSALRDAIVLLLPMLALILPQAMRYLAGWPLSVIAGVVVWAIIWAAIIGGLLSLALLHLTRLQRVGDPTGFVRLAWMLLFLLIAGVGPAWMIATGLLGVFEAVEPDGWSMLSPLSGLHELVRDRSPTGQPARVLGEHWRWLGFWSGGAAGLWVGVWLVFLVSGRGRGWASLQ